MGSCQFIPLCIEDTPDARRSFTVRPNYHDELAPVDAGGQE